MRKKTIWFISALILQTALVATVPAKQVYTRLTGKTITIRTAPRDPYSFLSGYHVILNYEISTPPNLEAVTNENARGQKVYVVLEIGDDGIWTATSTHAKRPKDIPEEALVLKGTSEISTVRYGIEAYYIPEELRRQIDNDLRENDGKAKAKIKVDNFGNATLIKLIIEDRTYEY